MKYFLLFLLLVALCGCILYYHKIRYSIEPFSNLKTERNIVLLGDSILKNNAYVRPIHSVEYFLKQKTTVPIACLAVDGAVVGDVAAQIEQIPPATEHVIFLSVGGNDILKNKNVEVATLFTQYIALVQALQQQFANGKIVLLNLYVPPYINNMKKDALIEANIKQWNLHMYTYVQQNPNLEILPLDTLLFARGDFVADYEPSEVGGMKIVQQLARYI